MWPASGVAPRHDRGERDLAVGVGLLHPAQVVLRGGTVAVHRVAALGIAVPEVHGGAGQRCARRGVADRQHDLQRHALGDRRRRTEAGPDVAAYDTRLGEQVGPVGAVAGVRPRRLPGDLVDALVARRRCRRGGARRAGTCRAARRRRSLAVGPARRQQGRTEPGTSDRQQQPAPVEQAREVEGEAAIVVVEIVALVGSVGHVGHSTRPPRESGGCRS